MILQKLPWSRPYLIYELKWLCREMADPAPTVEGQILLQQNIHARTEEVCIAESQRVGRERERERESRAEFGGK